MKRRSVTVLRALHEKHQGKLDEIQREAKLSVEAIIMCYIGDCDNCTANVTTGCLGGGRGGQLDHSVKLSSRGENRMPANDKN